MAIFGKASIIEHVRSMGLLYWKIYQNQNDKISGNYVASANFDIENLGQEVSMDSLQTSLGRLTAGQYLLSVYKKPGDSKGGVNTYIEVEGNGGGSAISGIGNTPAVFHLEGIGAVTAENFESAVEKKMQKMMDAEREKNERIALVKENADLKKQLRENEGGMNRGIMTIGSVLYGTISKSPAGKEFIGMAKDLFMQARTASVNPALVEGSDDPGEIGVVVNDEERLINAVQKLSKDNPDFLQQIEMMALVKETDPDTFNQGIEALQTIAG